MARTALGLGSRLLPLVVAFASVACAGAPIDSEEAAAEAEGALSTTFVYRCSLLGDPDATGWDAVKYVRASKTRVTWNTTRHFTKASGARIALRDTDYTPRGTAYAKYVENWQHDNHFGSYDWRLEPEMLAGGKKMKGGDLGGFAIFGARIDWYSSAKYVCFRD